MKSDESFVKLYEDTYHVLYRYVSATAFDKNLVEDIIQETYKTAFMKREVFENHENAAGWLMLTAKYKMMKMFQIESKHFSTKIGNEEYLLGYASSYSEDEIQMLELKSVLEKELTHDETELLIRYYIAGYTRKELMKAYNITSSCLKMRLKRIRDKLSTCLF